MAKIQELTDLFPNYDDDADGEINQTQFSDLMTELGLPYQYPGSVSKMFRKINYANPDKMTINLQQTIQYYSSFQTPSKHAIWKAKYSILESSNEIKNSLKQGSKDDAAPAAPGAEHFQHSDESPQDAKINILIGPSKPNYLSEIEIQIEKSQNNSKVKPFIKLVLTSSTPQRAKQIETVFKQNFTTFLKLLAEDISDWTQQMKNFHVNSMVQGTTTTLFFTTVNEELVSLIQLFSEQFELIYGSQLECKAHLKFEFEYDFQDFLKKPSSNFYDVFVKQSRLSFNAKSLRLMRQIKRYLKSSEQMLPVDLIQRMIPIGLLHLQEFGIDLEFDSFGNQQEYQLQTKQQLTEVLGEMASFLDKLSSGGMSIKTLLQLLDGSIFLEADVGQWRIKNYFRLLNINKIFVNSLQKVQQNNSTSNQQDVNPPPVAQDKSSQSYKSHSDGESSGIKAGKKPVLIKLQQDNSVQKQLIQKPHMQPFVQSPLSSDSESSLKKAGSKNTVLKKLSFTECAQVQSKEIKLQSPKSIGSPIVISKDIEIINIPQSEKVEIKVSENDDLKIIKISQSETVKKE